VSIKVRQDYFAQACFGPSAPLTSHPFLVSSFAAADAVAKLLIEKGIITEKEFYDKLSRRARLVSTDPEKNQNSSCAADMKPLLETAYSCGLRTMEVVGEVSAAF
jgi:hypothetical protein